jgi:hypothetical protein
VQCGVPVEVLPGVDGAEILRLGTDGRLYFIDRKGGDNTGPFPSGALKSVKTDGTDLKTLFTAPKGAQIFGVQVDASNVYVMQVGPATTGSGLKSYLSKVPLGGGGIAKVTPSSLGFESLSDVLDLFALDSGRAFVAALGGTAGSVTRVDLSSGVETVVVTSTSLGNFPQISGNDVWEEPISTTGGFVKVAKDASAGVVTTAGTKNCSPLNVTVTASGFLCGGSTAIRMIDPAATTITTLFDLIKSDPGEVEPTMTDGGVAYLVASASATVGRNLYKVTLADPPVVTVAACDRRNIKMERQHVPSFAMGSTDVFWIEMRDTATGIFRLSR